MHRPTLDGEELLVRLTDPDTNQGLTLVVCYQTESGRVFCFTNYGGQSYCYLPGRAPQLRKLYSIGITEIPPGALSLDGEVRLSIRYRSATLRLTSFEAQLYHIEEWLSDGRILVGVPAYRSHTSTPDVYGRFNGEVWKNGHTDSDLRIYNEPPYVLTEWYDGTNPFAWLFDARTGEALVLDSVLAST